MAGRGKGSGAAATPPGELSERWKVVCRPLVEGLIAREIAVRTGVPLFEVNKRLMQAARHLGLEGTGDLRAYLKDHRDLLS